jgi:hypothetical protein
MILQYLDSCLEFHLPFIGPIQIDLITVTRYCNFGIMAVISIVHLDINSPMLSFLKAIINSQSEVKTGDGLCFFTKTVR